MPLDSHSYLVAQGWSGKGTGLREGAISRPVTVSQKKTLAGVGKDRDDAFPFWDHVFSAASKSIQVKITADDDDSSDENDNPSSTTPHLKRTSTGILSNRRPIEGVIATSGSATPESESDTPRLSLIVSAKREAAKRGLYSRFFRGPIVGPDTEAVSPIPNLIPHTEIQPKDTETKKRKRAVPVGDVLVSLPSSSTSTSKDAETADKAARKEAKRLKLERRAEKAARKAARVEKRLAKEEKHARKEKTDHESVMASVRKQEIKAEVDVGIRDIDAEVESKESRRERK